MTLITGAVKVKNLPVDFALTNITELVKFLEKNAALQFDASEITNVFVSSEAPDTTQRDVIWYKINNAGSFVGIFVYVQDRWVQTFPLPAGIYKMTGNSNEVPSGYALITDDLVGYTAAMVSKLQESWLRDPTDSFWVIFEVVYIGL